MDSLSLGVHNLGGVVQVLLTSLPKHRRFRGYLFSAFFFFWIRATVDVFCVQFFCRRHLVWVHFVKYYSVEV